MNGQVDSAVRTRVVFAAAVAAVLGALLLQTPRLSASPVTPEGPTENITFNVTGGQGATDNLAPGSTVTFNVQTTTPRGLLSVEPRLCKNILDGWDDATFGYSGSSGRRCVRQVGITAGGLDADPGAGTGSPTYALAAAVYDGQPQTSANLTFTVGTGSVTWNNATGFSDTLACGGPNSSCAIVVKVETTTDRTWFIQTLTFVGDSGPSTTTGPTSSTSSTTSTSTTTSTTTTSTSTTTTTPSSTTATSLPVTTTLGTSGTTALPTATTVIAGGSTTGSSGSPLAFTGASTRDLLSVGLVLLAIGLFILGERERRRVQ